MDININENPKIINFKNYIIIIIFIFNLILNYNKNANNISETKLPKISIFMPIYNKEEYILRSILSIQNQTFKNIEIIAINDGSTDNTLKILKKLYKKDNRIKIINNDRNHGLLYSRAMGILNCSGDYLMNLDPDDKLKNSQNLYELYNKTQYNKYDLIIFLIERLSTNITNKTENYLTNLENKLQLQNDYYRITNKLIKRNIMLIAYKNYSKYIYNNKWNYHEDNIWNLLVKKYSKYILIY
jgi:glycosyltransferase involved in cell wall biosynthesis